MYAEIQGGFSAVKAALELVKAGKGVIDQATMASALYEVQQRLIDAQGAALQALEEQSKLARHVQELEAKLAVREDWKEVAAGFELTLVAQGVSVWTERSRDKEIALVDALKLCPNCFEQGHKSILQMQRLHVNRERSLNCGRCNNKIIFRNYVDGS